MTLQVKIKSYKNRRNPTCQQDGRHANTKRAQCYTVFNITIRILFNEKQIKSYHIWHRILLIAHMAQTHLLGVEAGYFYSAYQWISCHHLVATSCWCLTISFEFAKFGKSKYWQVQRRYKKQQLCFLKLGPILSNFKI